MALDLDMCLFVWTADIMGVRIVRGGRIPLIEMLLPRIARWRIHHCIISILERIRKARIEQFELDEGFQPYHPPFRTPPEHGTLRTHGSFPIGLISNWARF